MKVELLVSRAASIDGKMVGQKIGQTIEVDDVEGNRLIETGRAKKVGRTKKVEKAVDKPDD